MLMPSSAMRSGSTPRRLTAKSTTGVTTASQSWRNGNLWILSAEPCPGPSKIRQFHPRGLAYGEEHFFDRRVKTPVREQRGPRIIAADVEVVALQLDSLVGNTYMGPPRLDLGRTSERLDRASGGVRHARIAAWIVSKEELRSPVVIGGSQVGATGTDGVPVGSACIGDGGYPVCQGTPFPIPRLPVAGRDPFRGCDDLADIGP